MTKSVKRFLASLMAIALAVTTVLTTDITTAYAASASKSVKSVTLKIGSKNVTKKTKTMYVKDTATLKVTANPTKAKKSVTFKSSKASVAAVSSKGKITAKKQGTAKVTVTVKGKDNKKKSTYVNIKVKNRPVTKVKVSPTKLSIKVGGTYTIKATVSPSNATVKTVKWASSNKSVATVSSKGKVTAKAKGTTTITAKSGTKSAKCIVTVTEDTPADVVKVTGVSLNRTEMELAVNAESALTATVTPDNATNKSVVWSSADNSIATVDVNGKVKGIAAGTTKIIATTQDGGFKAECSVNVTDATDKNASAVSISIKNSLEKYKDTVLTGTNADVKVLVTNKSGVPLGNTSVTLDIAAQYGNAKNVFGITGDNNNYVSAKVTTDADGIASFTIGQRGGYSYNSTDYIYESYKLTATVTGSNITSESTLSFACIDTGDVEVLNNRDISLNDIEPGENAAAWDGIGYTYSTNGAKNEEYVSSQKVSTFDEDNNRVDDHRVYITAVPYIILPSKNNQTQIEKYYNDDFKKQSTEYSVYNDNDNEDTTTWIEGVPAGLQWATLIFSKISLSKYTTLEIKTYDAVTGSLIKRYVMDETNMKSSDFGYQIPIQEDTAVDIEVSLISEGQVNDDSNDGFTIDHVEGEYKTDLYEQGERIPIDGTVTWSESKTYYSEYIQMSYEKAAEYIKDSKYLSSKYTYAYEVPSFPNTGDAVIKVTDENSKIVAYFLYPTENQWKNYDGTVYPTDEDSVKNISNLTNGAGYVNKNDISRPSKYTQAVKASEEEVTNTVGTLVQEGDTAIVDSLYAGRTNLKATISIPGVPEEQFNITNGSELYTSVQWAPIPETEIDEAGDDFYAIATQFITVKAQLYDKNGNKVTLKDKKVTFKVDGEEITDEQLRPLSANTNVTIQKKEQYSDEQGQATIQFSANDDKGFVHHLTAECEGYTVKLLVGPNQTETDIANLYWVKLGLSFTDKVGYKQDDDGTEKKEVVSTTTSTLDGKTEVQSINSAGNLVNNIDSRKVGNNWILGYELVGNMDYANTVTSNKIKEIDNVKVLLSKSDDTDMTMTTEGQPNGAAKVYTEKTGSAVFIGELGNDSFTNESASDVMFTIVDEYDELVGVYENVGENAPAVSVKLSLNMSWEYKGKNVNIIYPQGNSVNVHEDTTAYIQVIDDYGNPIQNEKVTYSITGVNETTGVEAETDANGLVAVSLEAPGTSAVDKSSTISAVVDGTTYSGAALLYKDTTDTDFILAGATLDATNTENPEIKLTFSSSVNRSLLKAGLFKVSTTMDGVNSYNVESVRIGNNNNVVILTLSSDSKNIVNDTGMVTIAVKDYVEKGITYKLYDSNGRTLCSDNTTYSVATFKPKTKYTLEAVTNADNTQITVTLRDSNGNEITNTRTEDDYNIKCYSSVASVYPDLNGKGFVSGALRTIDVSPIDTPTTVYFYYCGASCSVTVQKQS